MTKVVFIGRTDYAICAQRVATAMNTVISDSAIAITWRAHPFKYLGQTVEADLDGAVDRAVSFLKRSENPWVVSMASNKDDDMNAGVLVQLATGCRHARLYIGTEFRVNSRSLLESDKRAGVSLCIISPDSMHLADKEIPSFPYLHTVPNIKESKVSLTTKPIRVCHSPSSLKSKGTRTIRSMVSLRQNQISLVYKEIQGVSYTECVHLRLGNHIFLGQHNRAVGGFGYSSVEAMAQGMVALATRNNAPDAVWIDAGLDPPPVLNLTPESFLKVSSSTTLLHDLRIAAHRYVHHGQMSAQRAGEYYCSLFA